jgi:quercetin dioxygenase-like cupin family protein
MELTLDRIYNPVQKDYATFLKTANQTGRALTLIEVELAPHGGNGLHRHTSFSEGFEVLDGELWVQIGAENRVLRVGEKALVPPMVNHRFYSRSDSPSRFLVKIQPGHRGFESSLRIAYGLAIDGQMKADGLPKNPLVLGVLSELGNTQTAGAMAVLNPVLALLAWVARRRGLTRALEEKYL